MPAKPPRIVIVMPAYNAEKTLERTVMSIPPGTADEIILVDDCSRDRTVSEARRLGLKTVVHEKNLGYGANQKTCYKAALETGADIVVMIHPDYQYDAAAVPYMTGLIKDGICDIMLGNRIRTRWEALSGGMPFYKYAFNRLLTVTENMLTGQNLGEWHSGLRAYSRRALQTIPWENNSDDFVFDCQFLMQAAALSLKIGDVPVPARYLDDSSSINFRRSLRYGLESLATLALYLLHKAGLWSSPIFRRKAAP